MISSPLADLDPAAAVAAFQDADIPITIARMELPTPDIAAVHAEGRWLLLADPRVPDEQLAAAVQDVEQGVAALEGHPGWMSVDLTPAHRPGHAPPGR